VRGSAGSAGIKPDCPNFANKNRSTGCSDQAAFYRRRHFNLARRLQAPPTRRVRNISSQVAALLVAATGLARGSGAPIATQASKSAMTAAGSFPLGGIFQIVLGVSNRLD